jgi:hypothetical protein
VGSISRKEDSMRENMVQLASHSLVAIGLIAAAVVSVMPSPTGANSDSQELANSPATSEKSPLQRIEDWALILEFPSGDSNALTSMTVQSGQLAGGAMISGKPCAFKVVGRFVGDDESGTFAMTWSGRGTCRGEVLTLHGDVVSDAITGTFTDTRFPGDPLVFTGTVETRP